MAGTLRMTRNKLKSYDVGIRAEANGVVSEHSFSLNNHSCSAMGTMGDEADWEAAAEGSNTVGDATWYIGEANGNSRGPFSEAQIEKLIAGGSTTLNTFVWRDGMADWKTIRDVETFAKHFTGQMPAFNK